MRNVLVFGLIGLMVMSGFRALAQEADSMTTPHKNRLQFEKSPYLLQHADNPVDWYPWGAAAFAKAREEQKPIFLSIGYSTCHWCHVMEHESFEDPQVARLLNEVFVCIKVDREERPDIDSVYMTAGQMMTGSGGWPLTIIMTPEKKPFFAGTYFPKTSRFGRIGMLDLIPRIQEIWTTEHQKALDTAEMVNAHLQQAAALPQPAETAIHEETLLKAAYRQLAGRFDAQHAGFGDAPKFPTPHTLMFLLRYWQRYDEAQALHMVEQTLQAMRRGGIYDHIGFGFHRYATDAGWLLPHFEKMLYDQALLVMAYAEAYQAAQNPAYAQTVHEILTYVLRDMTAPSGAFYSAEDADSEGVEGKFYVWSSAELRRALGPDDANLAEKLFNFADDGNFRDQASGLKTGENIVHLPQTLAALAAESGMTEQALRARLEHIRQTLFARRETRVHPHKDDKILTDWNGLMIAALARAGRVLNEARYTAAAEQAVTFILSTMRDDRSRLLHRYRDGDAAIPAHLDDYAFLIWGLLELYESTFKVSYLEQALRLNADLLADFWDEEGGGFYRIAADSEALLVRQKELYDGAVPSGNSVALWNLLRLGRLAARPDLEEKAARLARVFHPAAAQTPSAYTLFLLAEDFGLGPTYEVVIVGDAEAEDTRRMLHALHTQFLPNTVVVLRPTAETAPEIVQLAPYTEYHQPLDGRATAYVCRNYICSLPTTDVQVMLDMLQNPAASHY
jgi:uncharacterized protein